MVRKSLRLATLSRNQTIQSQGKVDDVFKPPKQGIPAAPKHPLRFKIIPCSNEIDKQSDAKV